MVSLSLVLVIFVHMERRSDGIGSLLETRRIHMAISSKAYMGDGDSSTRGPQIWVGADDVVDDNDFPSDSTAATAQAYGTARIQTAVEGFLFIPQPPPGWKIVSVYVSLMSKNSLVASNKQIDMFSRSYSIAMTASPQQSDHPIPQDQIEYCLHQSTGATYYTIHKYRN